MKKLKMVQVFLTKDDTCEVSGYEKAFLPAPEGLYITWTEDIGTDLRKMFIPYAQIRFIRRWKA